MTHEPAWKSEKGVVLITTLLLLILLMLVGMSSLGLSHSDLLVSRNLWTGTQALWLARAGAEIGKNWIEGHLPGASFPVTLGPTALASGAYTVTIQSLGSGAYRLTATGSGPDDSRRVVEETIRLPDLAFTGVITIDGDGLHPDFDDGSGGTGRRIPDLSVDGRNHALDGALASTCATIAPFAATQTTAQSELTTAANTLKREIVTRANSYCLSDGSSAAGPCTPGLFWVRGSATLPYFQTNACLTTEPTCYLNLDVSAAALRATGLPISTHLPVAPNNRGPFAPVTSTTPFVRLLTTTEQTRLQTAVNDLLQRAGELADVALLHLASSLHGGTYTYGSTTKPVLVQVDSGAGALDIDGGAVVNGAGVLLIPRAVQLGNATLNWKGLIVITGAGDLRVEDEAACGQVLGAVLVHDDATLDRKLDLDKVKNTGGCAPFAVNYSCEAVTRALTTLMRPVSWVEKYGS
jgi:hypothetical protein